LQEQILGKFNFNNLNERVMRSKIDVKRLTEIF
jgi:hypothetical protein